MSEFQKDPRRSETDFRNLVDTMPGGVLVHEMGKILYANAGAEKLLGAPAAELVGSSALQFIPPAMIEEALKAMAANATSGEPLPMREVAVRRRDGTPIVIEVSGIAVRFEGRSARLLYLVDVTERRATERRLRALVESSSLAVCSVDTQARIVSWNRAAERIFGWEPMAQAKIPRELPLETQEHLRALCLKATAEGLAEKERELVRSADGRRLAVRSSVAPLRDAEGKVEGFVLTTADVTGAHEAAESLRAAALEWQLTFDSVDAPVLLLSGPEREITRLNLAAVELAGPRPKSLLELSRTEPWKTAALLADMAERSRAPALEQVREGSRVWLVSAAPLTEGRLILTLRDVSRLVELQDSLHRAEAVSAMGSLVAGVAHEVRNPIFGMSATLDAMQQRFATDPAQEPFLRAMRRELDRVGALMRDLLEYGRPPAIRLAPDALAPVVALAARSCIPVADMGSVEIENDVGPEAGEVAMDAGRLAQVFQNLIENAVQHSPMGGKVRIDARRTPTHAAVRVTDSGPGFRPEDLGRIFEPFFSRRRGGTGLGLSIVQRIVEQHRGTIEAANRPEGGASVTVYLPV